MTSVLTPATATTDDSPAPQPGAAQGLDRTEIRRRRRRQARLRRLPLEVLLYAVMVAVIVIMSVPVIWMLLASLKTPAEIYAVPLAWVPEVFDLSNYGEVATAIPIARMFFNSVLITTVGAGLKVLLGLACAYALVFVDVPLRKTAFVLVLFALLIPGQITIIPNYTLIANLGWLNTYQGIIVPGLASAFGTFLFRQYFLGLPVSVLEAAQLDGAGHYRRLWRFVVPMSVPTIAAVSLVSIVGEWNEYLWPMLVVDNPSTMPLPVGLTLLQRVEGMQNWGVLMAATTLVTLPILVIFLILQRRLVAGLTAGAVTG
ncbi:carbohydrate ABC transporter permease [Pseudactinotalea sp. Z1739]|uniref:carbohydrate ABC transporter permease n=1 Tax=Pseudactinotalea sp. Z1739 TaxID=3413028 RepID=UPI003C7A3BCA